MYDSRWKLEEEEGISWLRGYHAADSPAIDACKVAQGLATKPEGQAVTGGQGPQGLQLTPPSVGGFGTLVGGGSISIDKNAIKTWIEEVLSEREYE